MSTRRLSTLLDAPLDPALADVEIAGLTMDSRAVRRGDAFVALAGRSTHGLAHAADANARGAACVLFEPPAPAELALPANAIAIDGLRGSLGRITDRFHGSPSRTLTVIGVTGTNGKTSTVQLLAQALDLGPQGPCGTIGTLGVGLSGTLDAGERTTPDVIAVHGALADLQQRGARAVAMEVSSHALDQGRVDAVEFDVAVFTNLSRDHLDYHGDMESYGAAKARLFRWSSLAAIVLNVDDAYGRRLAGEIEGGFMRWTVSAIGATDARLRATDVVLDGHGIAFTLREDGAAMKIQSPLLGRFNVDNLLAVAGVLRALGLPLDDVAARLAQLQPVPGRMNRIDGGPGRPLAVVDYAHTPDALVQALTSLRAHARGQLICVFGCGGERDRGKRPQMAQAAERLADRIIITDDNPRREDGDAIVAEIVAGLQAPDAAVIERDRARAIEQALAEAGADDIVLIAGKGHEPYQEIGGEKRPFDDAEIARRWLGVAA